MGRWTGVHRCGKSRSHRDSIARPSRSQQVALLTELFRSTIEVWFISLMCLAYLVQRSYVRISGKYFKQPGHFLHIHSVRVIEAPHRARRQDWFWHTVIYTYMQWLLLLACQFLKLLIRTPLVAQKYAMSCNTPSIAGSCQVLRNLTSASAIR